MRYLLILLLFTGCASIGVEKPKAKILFKEDRVEVYGTGKEELIKASNGTMTAEYDSRTQSLLQTIIEAAAVKGINKE